MWPILPRRLSLLSLVLLLGATAGTACLPQRIDPPRPEEPSPPSDPDFTNGWVYAHQYVITSRLDPIPIQSFAQLLPEQRRELEALYQKPDARIVVFEADGRLLMTLPSSHPSGEIELLLADDHDTVAVFYIDKKRCYLLPRDRLPDLLDGAPPSSQSDLELEMRPSPGPRPKGSPSPGRKLAGLNVQIALRSFPDPQKPRAWPVRIRLDLLFADELPSPIGRQPLLSVALPLLQSEEGLDVIDAVARRMGPPLRWSIRVINESKPSAIAPQFSMEVEDQGRVRVPRTRLSLLRPGYSEGKLLPDRQESGRQILSEATLGRLRSTKPIGPLRISNRSSRSFFLYLDGALLGWVNPGRQMSFKGIPEGYYRLFAVSPTGLRAWGPIDTYVPGPLTLE
jgi:hypothetical protein